MKKVLTFGLIFIFSLGLSITYIKNLALASRGGKAIDRVCTMQIDKASAETLTKDGYTYYFCSSNCKTTFAKSPAKYACICPQLFEGCDCGHCTGKGEAWNVQNPMQNPIQGNMSMNTATNMRGENTNID